MHLMLCMRGEPEQVPFLAEIAGLGAGIELGSYGMIGIQSPQAWETRFQQHLAIRAIFDGMVALHGPFIGMEYAHIDYMISEVVNRRLDMIFEAAVKLRAARVVLHSALTPQMVLFHLEDSWLKRCVLFWQQEICRWENAGIIIVIENETEKSPDYLIRLVDAVGSPFMGLCLDVGHQHVFSEMDVCEWVRRMDHRLFHTHLHDNDRTGDRHWPIGRGTINFEGFYDAVQRYAPQATLSIEVEDEMGVMMSNLRELAGRFQA